MITGKKDNLKKYYGISERIDKAIDFVLNFDESTPDGKYEIDGKEIYANITTINVKPLTDINYEAHRNYIDLQYIISGSETMVYSDISKLKPTTEYNAEKDCCMYKGNGSEIKLTKGDFYIVHPFDAHAPGYEYNDKQVRKIILKIMD